MNTYQFKKYPNAGSKSEWRKSKYTIETKQTLPTRAYSFDGTFDGEPATFIQVTERISGDTHLNEKRKIVGFVVQKSLGYGAYTQQTFKPDNVHLLFDDEGFHSGCSKDCCCQTIKDDQEFMKHFSFNCANCP